MFNTFFKVKILFSSIKFTFTSGLLKLLKFLHNWTVFGINIEYCWRAKRINPYILFNTLSPLTKSTLPKFSLSLSAELSHLQTLLHNFPSLLSSKNLGFGVFGNWWFWRGCVGLLVVFPAWVWWWCYRRECVGLMVVLPAWVHGFDGGAAGVGVGLMVVLPAWVWLGLYFGGFCGAGVWLRFWEKKENK